MWYLINNILHNQYNKIGLVIQKVNIEITDLKQKQ